MLGPASAAACEVYPCDKNFMGAIYEFDGGSGWKKNSNVEISAAFSPEAVVQ